MIMMVTQGEDLPEQDSVGPHVTLAAVDVVEDALWGHPADGEEALWRHQKF